MSDRKLRELERIAFETQNPSDIANYWKASLRAGILPKPTDQSLEGGWFWKLEPKNFPEFPSYYVSWNKSNYYLNQGVSVPTGDEDGAMHNLIAVLVRTSRFINESENTSIYKINNTIRNLLEWVIWGWETNDEAKSLQPPDLTKRKNPSSDKRIRGLERIASETNKPQDIVNYWRESLRAGILPNSNKQGSISKKWVIDPDYYLIWYPPMNFDIDTEMPAEHMHHVISLEADAGRVYKDVVIHKSSPEIKVEEELKKMLSILIEEFSKEDEPDYTTRWVERNTSQRRNPDEKIRRLEREGDNELQTAIENLRAGIPIVPNTEIHVIEDMIGNPEHWQTHYEFSDRNIRLTWEVDPSDFEKLFVMLRVIARSEGRGPPIRRTAIRPWFYGRKEPNTQFWIENNAENRNSPWTNPRVMENLYQALIEPAAPVKRNPDQKIRRLERSGDDEIALALQRLKAGFVLEPTELGIDPATDHQMSIFKFGPRTITITSGLLYDDDGNENFIVIYMNVKDLRGKVNPWNKWDANEICANCDSYIINENNELRCSNCGGNSIQPRQKIKRGHDLRIYKHPNAIPQGVEVWHLPEVISEIYNALIESIESVEKRNPDQKIRRLERESDDQLEIAIQKLRAGIPLEPTKFEGQADSVRGQAGWHGLADFNFIDAKRLIGISWIEWSNKPGRYEIKIGVIGAMPWNPTEVEKGNYTDLFVFPSIPIRKDLNIWEYPEVMEKMFEALVAPFRKPLYGLDQPYPNNYWPQSFFI